MAEDGLGWFWSYLVVYVFVNQIKKSIATYVSSCREESPLGEGTWRILHNHKASKHVKHFKCNFESGSTLVDVVHVERVLNCLWARNELASICAECAYLGCVKV